MTSMPASGIFDGFAIAHGGNNDAVRFSPPMRTETPVVQWSEDNSC
jgi:hypothetical protein